MLHLVGFSGSCQLAQIRIQNKVQFAQHLENTKFSCFAQLQPQHQHRLSSQDKGLLGMLKLGYVKLDMSWQCAGTAQKANHVLSSSQEVWPVGRQR